MDDIVTTDVAIVGAGPDGLAILDLIQERRRAAESNAGRSVASSYSVRPSA